MANKKLASILSMSDIAATLAEKTRLQAIQPNIYGYVPHNKQVIFHGHTAKYRLYIGGNRSGKTTAGIIEDIWWLQGIHPYLQTPPPPVHGRIVGVDFDQGVEKILKPQFQRWCPPSFLRGGSWASAYDAGTRTINFENGSTCEFMSYVQKVDSFAGTSRHFVHFDEEPPKEIWLECLARLIDTGGSYWMTLTPVLGMEWMFDDIYTKGMTTVTPEGERPEIGVIEVDMHENPHLAPEEIQTFINALDEDDVNARVKGKFIRRGGLIYKDFDIATHVIESLGELPKTWEYYISIDHGYNNPTSVHWHGVDPDGSVITFWEHYQAEMIVEEHAKIILEANKQLGITPSINICDPAMEQRSAVTGDNLIAEYAKHGVYLSPGNNDVNTGINKVNTYIKTKGAHGKPNWLVTENCEWLLKEIKKYRWKTWANKTNERQNNKYDVPHKKDDHAMDEIRYFFTFMPDLSPQTVTKKETMNNILNAAAGLPAAGAMYDTNLSKPNGIKQEWNIEAMDEYMGAQW